MRFNGKIILGVIFVSHMVVQTLALIAFFGRKGFTVKKKAECRNRRILILEALLDGSEFILINFCNANTECLNNLKLF